MSKPSKTKKQMLEISEIDIEDIMIDKLRIKKYPNSSNESKQCRITYNFKKYREGQTSDILPFVFKTPIATTPFGATTPKEDKDKPKSDAFKKYSIEINLAGSKELEELKEKLRKIDDHNVEFIAKECTVNKWWAPKQNGKPRTDEEIRDNIYNSSIKVGKEDKGNYPDRMRLKLPFYNGKPMFDVYDSKNKLVNWVTGKGDNPQLDWSWNIKNMEVEAIVECEAMWEVNAKVYCTFKVKQLRVHPPSVLDGCLFGAVEDNGEDNGEEAITTGLANISVKDSGPVGASKATKVQNTKVDDDDAEDAVGDAGAEDTEDVDGAEDGNVGVEDGDEY